MEMFISKNKKLPIEAIFKLISQNIVLKPKSGSQISYKKGRNNI